MRTRREILIILLGCCVLAASRWALASGAIHSLDDIQRTAHAFLTAQHHNRSEPPQIRLQSLDPRLRLPKCDAPLEAFLPSGSRTAGNTSVGVRCPTSKPWTVYQSATVSVYDRILVAGRFLRRGTVLSAADLKAERRELSSLSGSYETNAAQLIGRELQHALMAGAVISPRSVKMPPAIRRGETVSIVIQHNGIEVSSSGVALSDASVGERLQVRNAASERVIEGWVTANRRVDVGR